MALVQTLKATALTSSATAPTPISGFKMLDSQVAGHFALRSKPCEYTQIAIFVFLSYNMLFGKGFSITDFYWLLTLFFSYACY